MGKAANTCIFLNLGSVLRLNYSTAQCTRGKFLVSCMSILLNLSPQSEKILLKNLSSMLSFKSASFKSNAAFSCFFLICSLFLFYCSWSFFIALSTSSLGCSLAARSPNDLSSLPARLCPSPVFYDASDFSP